MADELPLHDHRWYAVELHNRTWAALDEGTIGPHSPIEQREQLLYGAMASTYHWMHAGTAINHARGEHLISSVATKVGRPDLGLSHAHRSLEIAEAHPDEAQEWDLGFAHEAIARAHAALGDPDAARTHRDLAKGIAAHMEDEEDKAILDDAIAGGDWYGI